MGKKKTYLVDGNPVIVEDKDNEAFLKEVPNAQEAKAFLVGNDSVAVAPQDLDAFLKEVPDAKPLFEDEEVKKKGSESSGSGVHTDGEKNPYAPNTEIDFSSLQDKKSPGTSILSDAKNSAPDSPFVQSIKPKVNVVKNLQDSAAKAAEQERLKAEKERKASVLVNQLKKEPTPAGYKPDDVGMEAYANADKSYMAEQNAKIDAFVQPKLAELQKQYSDEREQDPKYIEAMAPIKQQIDAYSQELIAKAQKVVVDNHITDKAKLDEMNGQINKAVNEYAQKLNDESPEIKKVNGYYNDKIKSDIDEYIKKEYKPKTKYFGNGEPIEPFISAIKSESFGILSQNEKKTIIASMWDKINTRLEQKGTSPKTIAEAKQEFMWYALSAATHNENGGMSQFALREMATKMKPILEEQAKNLHELRRKYYEQTLTPEELKWYTEHGDSEEKVKNSLSNVDAVLSTPDGDISAWLAFGKGFASEAGLPFIKSLNEISTGIDTYKISQKILKKQPLTPEEATYMKTVGMADAIRSEMPNSSLYNIGAGVAGSIVFLGEFAALNPVGAAVEEGSANALRLGLKSAGNKVKQAAYKEAIATQLAQAPIKFTKPLLYEALVVKPLSTLIGATAQTLASPNQVINNTIRRMTPQALVMFSPEVNDLVTQLNTDKFNILGYRTGHNEPMSEALPRGFAQAFTEIFTEKMFTGLSGVSDLATKGLMTRLAKDIPTAQKMFVSYMMSKYKLRVDQVDDFLKNSGLPVGGFIEEFGEDVGSGLITPWLTGDGRPLGDWYDPEKGFNLRTIGETAGVIAGQSLLFRGLGAAATMGKGGYVDLRVTDGQTAFTSPISQKGFDFIGSSLKGKDKEYIKAWAATHITSFSEKEQLAVKALINHLAKEKIFQTHKGKMVPDIYGVNQQAPPPTQGQTPPPNTPPPPPPTPEQQAAEDFDVKERKRGNTGYTIQHQDGTIETPDDQELLEWLAVPANLRALEQGQSTLQADNPSDEVSAVLVEFAKHGSAIATPDGAVTAEKHNGKYVKYKGELGIIHVDEGGKITVETPDKIYDIQGNATDDLAEHGIEPINARPAGSVTQAPPAAPAAPAAGSDEAISTDAERLRGTTTGETLVAEFANEQDPYDAMSRAYHQALGIPINKRTKAQQRLIAGVEEAFAEKDKAPDPPSDKVEPNVVQEVGSGVGGDVEMVNGFYTPSKNTQSSKMQSSGLPTGRFIALDAPFTSTVHDAKDAQKIQVNLKGKKVYNPDGVEGFQPTEDLSKELSVFANSKIKEGKKSFEELMTEFYQSKGYDAYVRLIDGGMRNNERELILFDRNTPLTKQEQTTTQAETKPNENPISKPVEKKTDKTETTSDDNVIQTENAALRDVEITPNSKYIGIFNGKEATISVQNIITDGIYKGNATVNVVYKDGSGGFGGNMTVADIQKAVESLLSKEQTKTTSDNEKPPTVEDVENENNAEDDKEVGDGAVGNYNPKFKTATKVKGEATTIEMPNGETREAEYMVVESDDILASHNEISFNDTEGFPKTKDGRNANSRNYKGDKSAQLKVNDDAANLKSSIVISDAATPDTGVPIISEDGIVLSGNGRTMAIKLSQNIAPEKYQAYKADLLKRAAKFGIDPSEVAKMKKPILVKVDKSVKDYSVKTFDEYNGKSQKEESPIDKAIKRSAIIQNDENLKERILSVIGRHETMTDLFENKSDRKELFDLLVANNIILKQETPKYVGQNGEFTNDGKDLINDVLIATILSPETLEATNNVKAFRNKIINALPVLSVNYKLGSNSLEAEVNDAIMLQSRIAAMGSQDDFWKHLRQMGMFDAVNPNTVIINRMINNGAKDFKKFIVAYNKSMEVDEHNLFGGDVVLTKQQVIDNLKESNLSENEKQIIANLEELYNANEQNGPIGNDEVVGGNEEQDDKGEADKPFVQKPNERVKGSTYVHTATDSKGHDLYIAKDMNTTYPYMVIDRGNKNFIQDLRNNSEFPEFNRYGHEGNGPNFNNPPPPPREKRKIERKIERKIRDAKDQKDIDDALDDLFKPTGPKMTMNGIDPDKLTKAIKVVGMYLKKGVHKFSDIIEDAYATYGDAVSEVFDALKAAYLAYLNVQATDAEAAQMDTNLRGVTLDSIINTDNNDDNRPGDSGADSPNPKDAKPDNEEIVPGNGGKGAGGRGGNSNGGKESKGGKGSGDIRPPSSGEQGDNEVDKPDGGGKDAGNDAGNSNGRGDDITSGGRPGSVKPGGKDTSGGRSKTLGEKVAEQKAAEGIEVVTSDIDNIRETLPFLLAEQQEDVKKAEDRFFGEQHKTREQANGKGILFTNGTGTGKTYTGLGIIKRFVARGAKKVLIVVPSSMKSSDWKEDGKNLGLDIHILADTKDAGKQVSVTTYANFRANEAIMTNDYDLVVYDESHRLLEEKTGKASSTSYTHYEIANKSVADAVSRLKSVNPLWIRRKAVQDKIREINKSRNNLGLMKVEFDRLGMQLSALEAELETLNDKIDQATPALEARAKKAYETTKVVFLSATPFKFHFNLRYANGFLFDWGSDTVVNNRGSRVDPESRFYLDHFGSAYEWKDHRLQTRPLANPDAIAMQEVAFADNLMKDGAMSGRAIDSPMDYSREFPIVSGFNAEDFNKAFGEIFSYENRQFDALAASARKVFLNYNYTAQLFESLKTSAAISRIQQHLDLGRKVVVFHRRQQANATPPFRTIIDSTRIHARIVLADDKVIGHEKEKARIALEQADAFEAKYQDLLAYEQTLNYDSAVEQITRAFPGQTKIINGNISGKNKNEALQDFNKDGGKTNILVVQEEAGKEGISLHDTTGVNPRVLMSMSMPISTTTALQVEGRIFRIGQKSNAIFEYPLLGLDLEIAYFGNNLNKRLSTTENLALGTNSRDLIRSYSEGVLNNSSADAPHIGQGVGGKEYDKKTQEQLTPFGKAKLIYATNQKTTGARNQRQGVDFYPTPEPLGQKMVEWADMRSGEHALEPSAGMGAIAMWVPNTNSITAIEPSFDLYSKLTARAGGSTQRIINGNFEDHAAQNKYETIVMNPPFGQAGSTAMRHVKKAFSHLREGGRMVAIVPVGNMDKLMANWLNEKDDKGNLVNANAKFVATIQLPSSTFSQAGTSVNTRVVIIDKVKGGNNDIQSEDVIDGRADLAELANRSVDLSGAKNIGELFDSIEYLSMPARTVPDVAQQAPIDNNEEAPKPNDDDVVSGVTEYKHTVTGAILYKVTTLRRMGDAWKGVNQSAVAHKGKYSPFAKGWLFTNKSDAEAFVAKQNGSPAMGEGGTNQNIHAQDYADKRMEAKTAYERELEQALEELSKAYAEARGNDAALKKLTENTPKTVRAFIKRLTQGITPESVAESKAALVEIQRKYAKEKAEMRQGIPRERGTNFIIEKLSRAARNGDISQETADLAIDLLRMAPGMFEDLAISISQNKDKDKGGQGWYRAADALVKIFKNPLDPTTAAHELLHHTERFMPYDVRAGIVAEWQNEVNLQIAYFKGLLSKETDAKKRDLYSKALMYLALAQERSVERNYQNAEDMKSIMLKYLSDHTDSQGNFHQGLGQSFYQLFDASEWWAVNASRLMQEAKNKPELKTWIDKVKAFLNGLIKAAKKIFKGSPTQAVEDGIKAIMDGRMLENREGAMLGDSAHKMSAYTKGTNSNISAESKAESNHALRDVESTAKRWGVEYSKSPSGNMVYNGEIKGLELDPSKFKRSEFDGQENAVKRIGAVNIDLSEPIKATIFSDGVIQVQDGHHRLIAAKELGKKLKVDLTFKNIKPELLNPELVKAVEQSLPTQEVKYPEIGSDNVDEVRDSYQSKGNEQSDPARDYGAEYIQWEKDQLPRYAKKMQTMVDDYIRNYQFLSYDELDNLATAYNEMRKYKYQDAPQSLIDAAHAILVQTGYFKYVNPTVQKEQKEQAARLIKQTRQEEGLITPAQQMADAKAELARAWKASGYAFNKNAGQNLGFMYDPAVDIKRQGDLFKALYNVAKLAIQQAANKLLAINATDFIASIRGYGKLYADITDAHLTDVFNEAKKAFEAKEKDQSLVDPQMSQRAPNRAALAHDLVERVKAIYAKFGIPIAEQKLFKARGFFQSHPEIVKISSMFNVAVGAHELMHYVIKKHAMVKQALTGPTAVSNQLKDIYINHYPGAKDTHAEGLQIEEGMTMLMNLWVQNPAYAQQMYGDAYYAMFDPAGSLYNNDVHDMAMDFAEIIEDYLGLPANERIGARIRWGQPGMKKRSLHHNAYNFMKYQIYDKLYLAKDVDRMLGNEFSGSGIAPNIAMMNTAKTRMQHWFVRSRLANTRAMTVGTNGNWKEARYNTTVSDYMDLFHDKKSGLTIEEFNQMLVARRQLSDYRRLDRIDADVANAKKMIETLETDNKVLEAQIAVETDRAILQSLKVQLSANLQNIDNHIKNISELTEDALKTSEILERNRISRPFAEEVMGLLENKYAEPARMFDEVQANVVDMMEATGMVSAERANEWRGKDGYASFRRYLDDEEKLRESLVDAVGANGVKQLTSLFPYKGSDLPLLPATYSQALAINEVMMKGTRNMMWQAWANAAANNKDVARMFRERTNSEGHRNDDIAVWVNGKKKFYQASAEVVLFANAIENIQPDKVEEVGRAIAKMLQVSVTGIYLPFALVNLSVDAFTRAQLSETKTIPVAHDFKTIYHMLESPVKILVGQILGKEFDPNIIDEYISMGGKASLNINLHNISAEGVMKQFLAPTVLDKAKLAADMSVEALSLAVNLTELMGRATEYRRAIAKGDPTNVAMMKAQNVAINWRQRGSFGNTKGGHSLVTKLLNTIAYSFAQITAFNQVVAGAKRHPVKTASLVALITAVYAATQYLIYAWGDDDEKREMANQPVEMLPKFIYLPNSVLFGPGSSGLTKIRIPELLAFPGTHFALGARSAYLGGLKGANTKPKDIEYFSWKNEEQLIAGTLPPMMYPNFFVTKTGQDGRPQYPRMNAFISSLIPTAGKTEVEVINGMKTYPSEMPIIPNYMTSWQTKYQYDKYTTETAKYLASVLDWSPKMLDYYITQKTGRGVKMIIEVGEYALGKKDELNLYNPTQVDDRFFFSGELSNSFYDKANIAIHEKNIKKNDLTITDDDAVLYNLYTKGMKVLSQTAKAAMTKTDKQIDALQLYMDKMEGSPKLTQEERTKLKRGELTQAQKAAVYNVWVASYNDDMLALEKAIEALDALNNTDPLFEQKYEKQYYINASPEAMEKQ